MELKIAIIGGYGGMGKLFAKIFKQEGHKVCITGPTEEKGKHVAKELGVGYKRDNVDAVKNADIVIITVPIEVTLDVIKEVAPHVPKNSLLMDFTSIKEDPCKAMKKFAKPGVEIIGTHPVFGPRVGNLEGQVFVLTPIRGKKWLKWLREFLEKHKCRVFETTPKEHDRNMAVVQGLTHFAYISIGKTLEQLNFNVKESRKISSPIYELMLDMVGRIIGQDPKLYAEIQMQNPVIPKVHRDFINVAKQLSRIVKKKDQHAFVEMMTTAAKHFGDVKRAMGRSDKAISSLVSELELLKNSVGKEICVEHIYSGKKHLGVVDSVTPDEVVLSDRGKKSALKLSNLRILGDKEKIKFKAEKFGTVTRDFSVLLNSSVDDSLVAELLKSFDENITSVKVKDVYSGAQIPKDKKSVCFTVEFVNANPKESESRVKKFFSGIGGGLR